MPHIEECRKIAEIIEGYRDGEFGTYDSSHVERWISQFDEDEQETVLLETLKILKKNYITAEKFTQFVNDLIESDSVPNGDINNYWRSVSILDIQKNGKSQDDLNDILVHAISDRYSVSEVVDKESDEFIYLDDFIFSGNRLYSDMRDWIIDIAPNKCRVCVITIGWFIYGQWNTQKKLEEVAKGSGKKIEFVFVSYKEFRFENRLSKKDYSEVFWPMESIINLDGYSDWFRGENFDPKYRQENKTSNKVFSNSRREDYERIMFKYGLKIMSFSSQNNVVVKPLGYSIFRGFGFGSTVFSFRNCPNNNPLVFWWGDPTASSSHPFSKWYPLLQRKTYGS